jgi:hypothetical protein
MATNGPSPSGRPISGISPPRLRRPTTIRLPRRPDLPLLRRDFLKSAGIAGLALGVQGYLDSPAGGQEESAQELYKKIEQQISGAAAFRVKFTLAPEKESPEVPLKAAGTLTVAKGNRIRLEVAANGEPSRPVLVSDGKQILIPATEDQKEVRRETPGTLTADWAARAARIGVLGPIFHEGPFLESDPFPRWAQRYKLQDFKKGPSEDGLETLTFSALLLKDPPKDNQDVLLGLFSVKLWYTPKTMTLRKRRVVESAGGPQVALVEKYEEWSFDASPGADDFKLPSK